MILVTGSRGFIGSHLLEVLKDEEVYEMDIKINRDILASMPPENHKITHVIHLAAKRSVSESEKDPRAFLETNCWGTLRLMRAFPKARFLNISSSSVNDVKSVYGATKHFTEVVGDLHPNCLSVRLYNVFGERQPVESGAVVPQFCAARIKGEPPIIYGDGRQSRDFTYVKDVVLNLKTLLFGKLCGYTHLGYGNSMSVLSLARTICQKKPKFISSRSFDIVSSRSPIAMDVKYGRMEGLKRTIKYYENFGT